MIGQGSFATVHKAKELATGRDVALKIVRPESELDICPGPNGTSPDVSYDDVLKAMKLEIQYIEAVGLHPNIIRVIGTAEDCRVFSMECAAADLYNLVKKQPQLPLAMVQRWSRDILEAVAHIHEMGVVHQVRLRQERRRRGEPSSSRESAG
jgi:serine/threonine protein kinase